MPDFPFDSRGNQRYFTTVGNKQFTVKFTVLTVTQEEKYTETNRMNVITKRCKQ